MNAQAYCLCSRGSNNVRGVAQGSTEAEVLVTFQNDGVVLYNTAHQVKGLIGRHLPRTQPDACIAKEKCLLGRRSLQKSEEQAGLDYCRLQCAHAVITIGLLTACLAKLDC